MIVVSLWSNQTDGIMQTINLEDGLLKEYVNIAVVQLESPFYSELDFALGSKNDDIFNWRGNKIIIERENKIMSILENIKSLRSAINVVVFPEYTVPLNCLSTLKEFSDKNNIIIVAGTDQVRDPNEEEKYRKNVCPVIIPNKEIYFVEKENPSDVEKHVVEKGDSEKSTLNLHWTYDKKDMSLQIFICLDYLENIDKIDKERPGGIIVTMCSPRMRSFEGYVDFNTRKGGGKFIILANSITLNKREKLIIRGRSAIYGGSEDRDDLNAIISLNNGDEGVLIAELNFSTPFVAKPSMVIGPSVTFKRKYKIIFNELREYYELKPIEPSTKIEEAGIINPFMFYNVHDHHLNFIFLRTREYMRVKAEFRDAGERHNFDSFGISGLHDVAIMHFGFEIEDFRKKIASEKIMANMDRWPYLTVSEIYKFYGFEPKKLQLNLQEEEDRNISDKLYALSRDWNTPEILEGEKQKFLKNGLIIGLWSKINLRKECMLRAFITIILPGGGDREARSFERNVIGALKKENGVISIYKTRSSADLPCNYLLDIVDAPYNLFDIVYRVHEGCRDLLIEVSTRTHIVADQLSLGLFKQLLSRELNHRQRMLLEELEEKGFTLNPHDVTDSMVDAYLEFREEIADIKVNEEAIAVLNTAVYPLITSIINKDIKHYKETFTFLIEFMEKTARKMLMERIKSKYGKTQKEFNLVQSDLSLAKKDVWKFTLHELIDAHIKWNQKYPEEITIPTDALEKLLEKKIVDIRNDFSHARTEEIKSDEVESAIKYLFKFISKQMDLII